MHALNSKENFDSHGIVGESVFCRHIGRWNSRSNSIDWICFIEFEGQEGTF